MVTAHGFSIIGLGVATSVDDLVVGFTLAFNVYYLPLHDIFTAIVIQAFLAIAVGQFLSWKVRTGSLRLNVDVSTAASRLTGGGRALRSSGYSPVLTPEITAHVIPHIYHPRYIPPLPHPAVAASTK